MAYYAKHPEKYSEEDCYCLAQEVIRRVKKASRVTTEYYGVENLPSEGGYIMYSNHQGKYDAIGIISGHKRPCSVLMDSKRSKMFIAKQFVDLLHGQRIDRESTRQQIRALHDLAAEVAEGKIYLVFPEGGYRPKGQDNTTNDFKYGCFMSSLRSKTPVVPVAIVDSYKLFGINSLKPVTTKVIFLPPIPYEEYSDLKAKDLSLMVKEKIDNEIQKWI
jgi:1-acyl-sn-glycerol-3-phosphate acyltransferase